MTGVEGHPAGSFYVSTHMPLARHDFSLQSPYGNIHVSTHMPLARHDAVGRRSLHMRAEFLLTCLLRGMTVTKKLYGVRFTVSTHMPLARHDQWHVSGLRGFAFLLTCLLRGMTTRILTNLKSMTVSTHMPLARHDHRQYHATVCVLRFYSHASCEA